MHPPMVRRTSARDPSALPDGALGRHGWMVMAVCCTALFMNTLDSTILNVALPSLQKNMHASTSSLQWAVDGYILVRASSLFLCGSLADRFGRRRCFNIGLITFMASSLACALAPNMGLLISFRLVQGLTSSLLTPASLAIVTNTFLEPRRRARAIGVWGAVVGLATTAGPVLGGILVESFGWRSVFFVNIPVGLIALAGIRLLKESKAAIPRPFDLPGQLSIAAALSTLTYALISAPSTGWTAPINLMLFASFVLCAAIFVIVEQRVAHPMLPVSAFRSRSLSGSTYLVVVVYMAMGAFLFLNTLYLQEVRGYSPLGAGLMTIPVTAAALVLAPVAGNLTGTLGPRLPAVVACVATSVSMFVLAAVLSISTPLWLLFIGYFLLGIGTGLINPPVTNAALSEIPREQAGVAGSVTTTGRQSGTNLGIALIGSIAFSIASRVDHARGAARHLGAHAGGLSFITGVRYGDLVAGVLTASTVAVAWWGFRPHAAPGPGTGAPLVPVVELVGEAVGELG